MSDEPVIVSNPQRHPCHVNQTPQPKASLDCSRPRNWIALDISNDSKDPDPFASGDHVVDCDQCDDVCLLWPWQGLCSPTTTHPHSRVDLADPRPGRRYSRCPRRHGNVSSQDSQGKLSYNFLLDRCVSDRASVVALKKRWISTSEISEVYHYSSIYYVGGCYWSFLGQFLTTRIESIICIWSSNDYELFSCIFMFLSSGLVTK